MSVTATATSPRRSDRLPDTRRLVLHVGLPKSGTTFLQHALAANAPMLADRGVLYPQTEDDVMFRAALDVRGNHVAWGRARSQVAGAWDALCEAARGHVGTTVVSHELLAAASQRQIDAATTMLRGLDVHVVVTVRDPARQLVSEWQEGIKHGRTLDFEEYVERVREGDGSVARRFRSAQDLTDVLHRWGHHLPADHLHVVVAGRGGARDDLWRLFGRAVGFDADGFPAPTEGFANPSLGVDGIDLVRRLNVALDGRLKQPHYGRIVKHRIAHELLADDDAVRPGLPAPLHDPLREVAESWAKEVRSAGYVVHGDLDDLLPVVPEVQGRHPDDHDPRAGLELATGVLAEVVLELARVERRLEAKDAKRRAWKRRAKALRARLGDLG